MKLDAELAKLGIELDISNAERQRGLRNRQTDMVKKVGKAHSGLKSQLKKAFQTKSVDDDDLYKLSNLITKIETSDSAAKTLDEWEQNLNALDKDADAKVSMVRQRIKVMKKK